MSQRRKDRFFVGDKEWYSSLEDIFLAMEGLAMWVQYRTARERAPSGEEWLKTLITLSERHDAWSQEQGLGLFLLIDRLVPGWQARFLAPDFPSPFTVLREAVGRRTPLDRAAPNRGGSVKKVIGPRTYAETNRRSLAVTYGSNRGLQPTANHVDFGLSRPQGPLKPGVSVAVSDLGDEWRR